MCALRFMDSFEDFRLLDGLLGFIEEVCVCAQLLSILLFYINKLGSYRLYQQIT